MEGLLPSRFRFSCSRRSNLLGMNNKKFRPSYRAGRPVMSGLVCFKVLLTGKGKFVHRKLWLKHARGG